MSAKRLEYVISSYLPPALARLIRHPALRARYLVQARACRVGFRELGHVYPQKILFIAGLPKSGTTWLKNWITSYPGFHELLIPESAIIARTVDGSYDYQLPGDMFSRFSGKLVVTKMHIPGSPHNAEVLRNARVSYVILYRDLRDVAVSYYFYVRRVRWHPEHQIYARLSVTKGLETFARRVLAGYADWVRSWLRNRDPSKSLVLQYEQMLQDPMTSMTRVAKHFELDASPDTIAHIVEVNSFRRVSGGRQSGQEDRGNFFRKGAYGDWMEYFTPELRETYKRMVGDLLIQCGYEQDESW